MSDSKSDLVWDFYRYMPWNTLGRGRIMNRLQISSRIPSRWIRQLFYSERAQVAILFVFSKVARMLSYAMTAEKFCDISLQSLENQLFGNWTYLSGVGLFLPKQSNPKPLCFSLSPLSTPANCRGTRICSIFSSAQKSDPMQVTEDGRKYHFRIFRNWTQENTKAKQLKQL